MYRVIAATQLTAETLGSDIWNFLEECHLYATQNEMDMYYITKRFQRTINGKKYIFKLQKSRLIVTSPDGSKVASMSVAYGYDNISTKHMAKKVLDDAQ